MRKNRDGVEYNEKDREELAQMLEDPITKINGRRCKVRRGKRGKLI